MSTPWVVATCGYAVVVFGVGLGLAYELIRWLDDRKSAKRVVKCVTAEEDRLKWEAARLGAFAVTAREIESLPTFLGVND